MCKTGEIKTAQAEPGGQSQGGDQHSYSHVPSPPLPPQSPGIGRDQFADP